jgi:polysaccharide deacetylase family protein (PEP-CTERM system associated)
MEKCMTSAASRDAFEHATPGPRAPVPPVRCLSFDVEEYFHIEAAHGRIRRDQWDRLPSRVEASVETLLGLLARHRRPATFFVLGDVARRCPRLGPRIAAAGHEIASHGSMHDRLHRLDPRTFRQDLLDSRRRLEDQTGRAVIGYRAPTWSVTRATGWAIDVLAAAGFGYDASIFPVRHPWYGVPDGPRGPYLVQHAPDGPLLREMPPLTWRAAGRNWPAAGGGYFRLLPLWLMQRGLAQAARDGRPAILYFHPWEFDPDLPEMPLSLTDRIRTYTGLRRSLGRLERIIAQEADWRTIADALPPTDAPDLPCFTLHRR